MDFFTRLGKKKTPTVDQQTVARAVKAFLATVTWDEAFSILERERTLLLTDIADQLLTHLLADAQNQLEDRQIEDQMLQAEVFYLRLNRQVLRSVRNFAPAVIKQQCQEGLPDINKSRYLTLPTNRACMIFINASWEERRRILEEEQAWLLGGRADAFISVLIFHQQSPDLELCRILLRRAREIGVPEAWTEFERLYPASQRPEVIPLITSVDVMVAPHPFVHILRTLPPVAEEQHQDGRSVAPHSKAIDQALEDFLCAALWHGKRDVLAQKEALLRADDALKQLLLFIARARQSGMPELVKFLEIHHQLLKRVRETGVAEAWAELEAAYHDAQIEPPKETAYHATSLDPLFDELKHISLPEGQQRFIEVVRELIKHVEAGLGDDLTWAWLHYVLAESRPGNSLSEKIEETIRCYRKSLVVYTSERFPHLYAHVLTNLGILYGMRVDGSRSDNLEEAIRCYREVLAVQDLLSQKSLSVLNNVGLLLTEHIKGKRVDNLKQAIICLNIELFLSDPSSYSVALTKINLAKAHARVADLNDYYYPHDREQELAIKYCREALGVLKPSRYPQEHSGALINLANAYSDRRTGSPSENIEQAIVLLESGLQVCSPENFPHEYAGLQHNLAAAYQRRIEGVRSQNINMAMKCLERALQVWPFEFYPWRYIDAYISKANMAFYDLVTEAEKSGDTKAALAAYKIAHEAYTATSKALAEFGWQEVDERGYGIFENQWPVRELYANHAWCLCQMGDTRGAVAVLEDGRARILTESLSVENISLKGVCMAHAEEFTGAKRSLREARRTGDQSNIRKARDTFLAVRQAIRQCCQPDFLPSQAIYQDVAQASAPEQTLIYIAATSRGGVALIVSPVQSGSDRQERVPVAVPLPLLTEQVVKDWRFREDADGNPLGGFYIPVNDFSDKLLKQWNNYIGSQGKQQQMIATLQDVDDILPETMSALRQALHDLVKDWTARANALSAGNTEQQAEAKALRAQLARPFADALLTGAIKRDLDWYLQKAELDCLLPELSGVIMQPLRQGLNALGLTSPSLPIALIPCGLLGSLPLHAALVPHPQTGEPVPFQETCELTYQPSARTLAVIREAAAKLPANGPVIAVGNPLPTWQANLCYAEQEALANVYQARKKNRPESIAIVGTQANLSSVYAALQRSKDQQDGSWVEIAGHGYADPDDSHNSFMLMGGDEKLTLAMLRNEQLLTGVRCFSALGCVTGPVNTNTSPDELTSFAAGILQAGAASAIATLWSVSDKASFYLMLRFHQIMLDNLARSPAWALREAASWLRKATRRDLDEMCRFSGVNRNALVNCSGIRGVSIDELPDVLRGVLLKQLLNNLIAQHSSQQPSFTYAPNRESSIPYAHPIYWAAAIVYGA